MRCTCCAAWSRAGCASSSSRPGPARRRLPSPRMPRTSPVTLRLHVRVDERTAGFLALGLAMGSRRAGGSCHDVRHRGRPTCCPRSWRPRHSGRQVVVVSADRPAALRGTGREPDDLAGRAVRAVRAVRRPRGGRLRGHRGAGGARGVRARGPQPAQRPAGGTARARRRAVVAGPRRGGAAGPAGSARPTAGAAAASPAPVGEALPAGPPTVVVAGDDAGPAARQLAEAAGVPLLAEPTSGARAGPNAIRTYRLLLGTPLGDAGRAGRRPRPPHPVASGDRVAVATRRRGARRRGAGRRRDRPGAAGPAPRVGAPTRAGLGDPGWLAAWRQADTTVAKRLDGFVDGLPELDALHVARGVADALHRVALSSSAPPTRCATSTSCSRPTPRGSAG